MFEVGDKVICIEPNQIGSMSIGPVLVEGQEYTVTKVEKSLDATFIHVDNINFGWRPTRFKKTDKTEATGCRCSIMDLMSQGCKCGQWEKEKKID